MRVVFDPTTKAIVSNDILRSETGLFVGDGMFYTGAPNDHRFLVATYQNFTTPTTLALLSDDGTSMTPIVTIEPRLMDYPNGQVEFFSTEFTDHTGQMIELSTAVLLPPNAQRGDGFPVLVEQYGGANLSTASLYFGGGYVGSIPAAVFTTRGYGVLMVEVQLGPEGVPANPLQEITAQVVAQVEQAIALGYVDPNRVVVTGQSYGGYGVAAILSATNIFTGGIAVAGIYDLPSAYAWGLDNFGVYWSEQGQGRMGASVWEDLPRYLENSPYYRADHIQTPLLLVHGALDTTCAVEESQKLFVALRELDREVELLIYARGGHVITEWSQADAIDVTMQILDFLERTNP
jgi:dipeptidyl aminopeptidase/acylaminoacyl peptidase